MAFPTSAPAKHLIIRYKGLFDFDGLYYLMVQWLKQRRYWFHEIDYKHKVPSPAGAEQEIKWEAEKKINDYMKYKMNIFLHTWDQTEVEVVKNGEKKTLTSARIEITFDGTIEIDYEKRMSKSKFWAAIADVYYKYFLKEDIESIHYDTMYYRLQRLHSLVKNYLDMGAKGFEYEGYLGDNA
jgi:hypothetical protein